MRRARIYLHFDRLAGLDARAIDFADFRGDFHLAQIQHFRDDAAGENEIALSILGQHHAGEEHAAAGVLIVFDANHSVERRDDFQILQIGFGALELNALTIPLLFKHRDAGFGRNRSGLYVLF